MQVVKRSLQTIIEANDLAGLKDPIQNWRSQLALDYPELSAATRESIIRWLIGNDLEQFAQLDSTRLEMTQQQIECRYQILRQRYLGASPQQAYRNLMTRLVVLRHKARAWLTLSRKCRRVAVDVLQEVLQELLTRDIYMQQQIVWIAECSGDAELRNALLFASLEEYCSRPVGNRRLAFYQFLNHLRHLQRQV